MHCMQGQVAMRQSIEQMVLLTYGIYGASNDSHGTGAWQLMAMLPTMLPGPGMAIWIRAARRVMGAERRRGASADTRVYVIVV